VGGIPPRGRRHGYEALPVVSKGLLDALKIRHEVRVMRYE
jgi:hypothetical protein